MHTNTQLFPLLILRMAAAVVLATALRSVSKQLSQSFLPGSTSKDHLLGGGPGVELTLQQRWMKGNFTIMPENNNIIDVWDSFVIVALMATAILLPFEIALITEPPPELQAVDHCIDLIFTIDILLTFNIAYVPYDHNVADHYERSPVKIARHYTAVPFSDNGFAGWFWPDVLTVVPWDVVTSSEAGSELKSFRVLRLVRMLRLVRVVKLFKRLHTKVGFSFALVKIMRCMGVTLLLVHWLACGWAHLGLHGHEYAGDDVNWLMKTNLASRKEVADFTILDAYTLALYFCFVVLTTVGFGDITPLNGVEVTTMTVTIFLTGLTWAWVVANVVDVISHMDLYGLQFNQVMDDLNQLMKDKFVDHTLQVRVRKHLHEAYHVHRHRHHQTTVRWLSDGLQGELAAASGVESVCAQIWYFANLPTNSGWLIDLAQHFKAEMYSPDEYLLVKDSVTVIRRGSCVRKGRILMRDAVVGEDMILLTEILKDSSGTRTMSLCEVMTLHLDKLLQVCEKHDELNLRIRNAQIKLALWRAFIFVARKLKKRLPARRASVLAWDTILGDDEALPPAQEVAAKAEAGKAKRTGTPMLVPEEILVALTVKKRDGWVQTGGGVGTVATNLSRKVQVADRDKSDHILELLRGLRGQVQEHQEATARRLDALARHLDAVDRRTEGLERRRVEELERVEVSSPSPMASKNSTGGRTKKRFGFG